MRKIKDPIMLGIVAGLIGNIAKLAGNLFNRHVLYKSDTTYSEIAGGLFMSKREREKSVGKAVGGIADFVLSALLGIPLVYILRYTGQDKAVIKGTGYGHLAWMAIYGAFGRLMGVKRGVFPLNADTNMSAFANHAWYGAVTALVINKLGDPSLFPEPKSGRTPDVNIIVQADPEEIQAKAVK
ncbi:MAG: hypothetical protein RO469_01560 [Thermincola sp.]|jgi:hypothetical protein|nr:hypothetical protein [Thermincola sp.]MDT3702339.1 hypothetical protein [Thermincola sp.]